jgi:hypothetical protein
MMATRLVQRLVVGMLITPPLLAQAQVPTPITDVDQFGDLACNIAGVIFNLAITVSIIMILYAAFLYMTASGDTNKISRAHSTVIYSVVGIVVAIIAGGLPALVYNILDPAGAREAASCD